MHIKLRQPSITASIPLAGPMDWALPFLVSTSFSTIPLEHDLDISAYTMDGAPPSDQMRASGSGRRKVALPPGRSQLDWMKNSRRVERRRPRAVTLEEVAKHNSRTDAWLVIEDVVYNVTPYLEYHPGGVTILATAAGKDATSLFNKYHPWVNVQSMLDKHVIGYLSK